jgi:transcriptional regulator with XRE-family HTH domain
MARKKLSIYLRTQRMRWCLSQEELGLLLGMTKSAVSRFETEDCPPSLRLVIATEVIFGAHASEAFPALYGRIQDEVMRRAGKLDTRLRKQSGKVAERKRALLSNMVHRAEL